MEDVEDANFPVVERVDGDVAVTATPATEKHVSQVQTMAYDLTALTIPVEPKNPLLEEGKVGVRVGRGIPLSVPSPDVVQFVDDRWR